MHPMYTRKPFRTRGGFLVHKFSIHGVSRQQPNLLAGDAAHSAIGDRTGGQQLAARFLLAQGGRQMRTRKLHINTRISASDLAALLVAAARAGEPNNLSAGVREAARLVNPHLSLIHI